MAKGSKHATGRRAHMSRRLSASRQCVYTQRKGQPRAEYWVENAPRVGSHPNEEGWQPQPQAVSSGLTRKPGFSAPLPPCRTDPPCSGWTFRLVPPAHTCRLFWQGCALPHPQSPGHRPLLARSLLLSVHCAAPLIFASSFFFFPSPLLTTIFILYPRYIGSKRRGEQGTWVT